MDQLSNKENSQYIKVERMGVFFEKSGLTPMHGRVFAFLLLAEPPYKDFYAIQEFLKASKSAISGALKFLQSADMVDYITFSGDRRKYFRANLPGWLQYTKNNLKEINAFKDLLEEVLEDRSDSKHLEFNEGLQNLIDFHKELSVLMDKFILNWEQKHK